ncbi:hypothetical protein JGK52_03945 [Cytobacillus oceanisediminis]|uniref:hypothetical protein n=1 Tax=Cytobacillus oceanisediminis TaxID=665099 RepID=UPI001D1540F0|nr:hypothetical protein [Cytobacillus oceanisediminis]MCC3645837.1 hypothetical protein [Cytobacillus oceanisediminis]
MLVKFISTESPLIILEKRYNDILPLLEMIKQKAEITIFLDQEGEQRLNGRLFNFEYIIEENGNDLLLIYIECEFNNMII